MQKDAARKELFQAYWSHTVPNENQNRAEYGLPELTEEEIQEKFNQLLKAAGGAPYAVIFDADAVRQELEEFGTDAQAYDLPEEEVEAVMQLPDETIVKAVEYVLDDAFWEQFNHYRSAAIRLLLQQI